MISRDSDPSFGVADKASGLGEKSPGKAHLKGRTDCSFREDESHFALHLASSTR